jgi:hypothetical protein
MPTPPKKFEEISCFSELAILSEWWESFLQKGLRNNTGTGTWHYLMKFCKSKTPSLKYAEMFKHKMTTAAHTLKG